MPDWSWKLRLFASADLVGSTAYKQSRVSQEWARTFKEFFQTFPEAVEAAYGRIPANCPVCEEKLSPWKFSGDEILFNTRLTNHQQVVSHLAAFKEAVRQFPTEWAKKGVPLKLKATAWIAGFPVNNTELEIDTGSSKSLDFIGPSIDLGFRISRFADTRRFVLSADLALLVLDAIHSTECDSDNQKFQLHLHGREPLKGVIGNEPYPIVWLDVADGAVDVEEELLGIKRVPDPDKLTKYLRQFLDHTPTLMRPFIEGDTDPKYAAVSERLNSLRDKMRAEESERGYLTSQGAGPGESKETTFKQPLVPDRDSVPSPPAS